jgi:Tfp pilus assembly major pilin PilA
LTALAAGTEQWKEISLPSFVKQAQHSSGFWMSLHELLSGYPWLTKRALRIMDPETAMPKRNSLAYLPALFLPYSGRLGAGFSLIVLIYILGVGAALAIPAYHDYTVRAKLQAIAMETEPVRQGLKQFWETNGDVPASLSDIGIEPKLPSGNTIVYDPEALKITVTTQQGDIIFAPRLDDQKKIQWVCEAGKGIKASHLPKSCREADEPVGQP